MKITKRQLRKIIKEEKQKLIREYGYGNNDPWEELDIALADIIGAVGEESATKYINAWVKNDHKTMIAIKNTESEDEYDFLD